MKRMLLTCAVVALGTLFVLTAAGCGGGGGGGGGGPAQWDNANWDNANWN